jgi:hypothetical protein
MRWTEADLRAYEDRSKRKVSSPEPEPAVCHEPLGSTPGKEEGPKRIAVCITGFRRRLLDADNFAGAKYLIDGLRYANVIPGDRPDQIELTFRQVKVKTKPEERTQIEIDLP